MIRRQIRPATGFHLRSLAGHRICLHIAEKAGRRRFTSRANGIPSGNANWTSRVCIRKAESPAHQSIEVRGVNVRVTERSDGIEPLLVRHDEQYIGSAR